MNTHRPYAAAILLAVALVFVLAIGSAVRGAVADMRQVGEVQTMTTEDGS